MKQKIKKEDFLYVISMLLGTLGANLLQNMLVGGVDWARNGIIRASYGSLLNNNS